MFWSPPTRVVWIEISSNANDQRAVTSHHPHGWCGLKFICTVINNTTTMSPPTRVVWIEIISSTVRKRVWSSHHPHGWCGLKSV